MKSKKHILGLFVFFVLFVWTFGYFSSGALAAKKDRINFNSPGKKYSLTWENNCPKTNQYEYKSCVNIFDKNKKVKSFTLSLVNEVRVIKNFFGSNNDALVLIGPSSGSGCIIDWWIIGKTDSNFIVFLEREGIFNGGVEIEGKVIKEWRSSQCTCFGWNGKKITEIKCTKTKMPEGKGIHVVTYEINANENVSIKCDDCELKSEIKEMFGGALVYYVPVVKMRVGEKFYLIRTNKGPAERIMYNLGQNPIIESFVDSQKRSAWIAKNPGQTEISIIPGGYSKKKTKKIIVEVE